jgi:trans-aconitate 2-methyltransferase
MAAWDPSTYLRFADERTRPAADLAARIAVDSPAMVVDLGCGPGNSTEVLRRRWPGAVVLGLDSSAEMIAAARAARPEGPWLHASIDDWRPATRYDVVFANATLHWLPDHGPLVTRLFGWVAAGGALAFQIPSADHPPVRRFVHEIAREGPWAARMAAPLAALTMEPPAFYYDHLCARARALDIWETEYVHVLESSDGIIDWIAATGLRPFLEVLSRPEEVDAFVARLRERVVAAYPTRPDGRVLFPFKRTFVIAYA